MVQFFLKAVWYQYIYLFIHVCVFAWMQGYMWTCMDARIYVDLHGCMDICGLIFLCVITKYIPLIFQPKKPLLLVLYYLFFFLPSDEFMDWRATMGNDQNTAI